MDQRGIAKRLGVSNSAVSLWETGRSLPKPKHVPKLARLLGIDAMTLTKMLDPDTATAAR
jgi:transcriptional regulator with XRE-family HTH domain